MGACSKTYHAALDQLSSTPWLKSVPFAFVKCGHYMSQLSPAILIEGMCRSSILYLLETSLPKLTTVNDHSCRCSQYQHAWQDLSESFSWRSVVLLWHLFIMYKFFINFVTLAVWKKRLWMLVHYLSEHDEIDKQTLNVGRMVRSLTESCTKIYNKWEKSDLKKNKMQTLGSKYYLRENFVT